MNIQEIWLRISQISLLSPHKALKIIHYLMVLGKTRQIIFLRCGLSELQCMQFSSLRLSQALKWLEKKRKSTN